MAKCENCSDNWDLDDHFELGAFNYNNKCVYYCSSCFFQMSEKEEKSLKIEEESCLCAMHSFDVDIEEIYSKEIKLSNKLDYSLSEIICLLFAEHPDKKGIILSELTSYYCANDTLDCSPWYIYIDYYYQKHRYGIICTLYMYTSYAFIRNSLHKLLNQ